MTDKNITTTPTDFTQWAFTQDVDDQGDYGLMPGTDGERHDGATFYVCAYEDGEGGLILSVHASKGVKIEIIEDDENLGDITYTPA